MPTDVGEAGPFEHHFAQGIVEAGERQRLNHGLHGFGKVSRGKEKLKPILVQNKIDPQELFEFLYDDQRADDSQLPETGLSIEREKALSSMFIKTENYGSRCSTVILVDQFNQVQFIERVYNLKAFEYTTSSFEFSIGIFTL